MKEVNEDDLDKLLLLLQKELSENEQEGQGTRKQAGPMFHGFGIVMVIPAGFEAVEKDRAGTVFFSKNRPEFIFLHTGECAGITIQAMDIGLQNDEIESTGEEILGILKKSDGKNVFYDKALISGNVPILWFDYKSFASDGLVYNMMFLFRAKEKLVLGTFYCIFKDYDRWKLKVLNMLGTVQTEEAGYERI